VTVESSRFARPIAPGAEHARTIGWWGMLLGIIALAHFVGALVVAYLYIRAGHAEWPPPGVELPPLVWPAVATGLTALAATLATLEVRWTARHGPVGMAGALGAIVVGSGAVALRMLVLVDAGFRWDDHAYGSLYWLLQATDITLVASGVIGSATILAQHAMGDYDTQNHDEIRVLSLYWWFAVAASAGLYVTTNLVPYMGG
jgi:cytochrome c oxidase subunit III